MHMKKVFENFGVALFGLITSLLTAIAVVAIERATTINVFSFTVWVIVPAGALLTGFVAASGYYFGSLYFHTQATKRLVFQMVVIAGLTNLLIYYLGYSTYILDDGRRVADYFTFREFLDIKLTTMSYRFRSTSNGALGSFGYVVAAIQFVGFLFGGLSVYGHLSDKPVCEPCQAYLRPIAKRFHKFDESEKAGSFWDQLHEYPFDSHDFADLVRSKNNASIKPGGIQVVTELQGCPKCKKQRVFLLTQVWNGKDWNSVPDMHQRFVLPEGINISASFKDQRTK
jgi:hypothetical protein